MGKLLCRVMSIALLIGGIINLLAVFASSPAFTSDQRQKNANGGWRVPNVVAHYDKAEYLQEIATTYLDQSVSEGGTVAPPEQSEAHTRKAFDLLNESVRLDPANASGWTYLAQAQGRSGDYVAMRESLARSWSLAPHDAQLATVRLQLSMQIDQASREESDPIDALSEEEVTAARRDSKMLQAQSPDTFERLISPSDPFRDLLDDL